MADPIKGKSVQERSRLARAVRAASSGWRDGSGLLGRKRRDRGEVGAWVRLVLLGKSSGRQDGRQRSRVELVCAEEEEDDAGGVASSGRKVAGEKVEEKKRKKKGRKKEEEDVGGKEKRRRVGENPSFSEAVNAGAINRKYFPHMSDKNDDFALLEPVN
ncbi:hypothetical protein CRG98_038687 [Punica granatum]|uniref:Uncharacterized protein n=1 Tax=Punica granatum TaxID=22663 RepID=A0A2I0IAA8_PUNGR|nr:hypothetical protein CRG98_038687 [Punica granatum]